MKTDIVDLAIRTERGRVFVQINASIKDSRDAGMSLQDAQAVAEESVAALFVSAPQLRLSEALRRKDAKTIGFMLENAVLSWQRTEAQARKAMVRGVDGKKLRRLLAKNTEAAKWQGIVLDAFGRVAS